MMKHRIARSVSAIHLSKSVSETTWHRSETRRTWSRVSHVGIERNEDRCSRDYVAPSPATQTPRIAGSRCSWLAPKTVSRAGGPRSASQGPTCLTVPAAETASLCTRKVSLRPCQPGLKEYSLRPSLLLRADEPPAVSECRGFPVPCTKGEYTCMNARRVA